MRLRVDKGLARFGGVGSLGSTVLCSALGLEPAFRQGLGNQEHALLRYYYYLSFLWLA